MSDKLIDELVDHLGIPGRRRWLGYAVHVGQAAPYVYVEVPKAACTTVKSVLRQVEGHGPLEHPMDIHNREKNGLPGLSASDVASLEELFATHTWFTVVRHPLERLLSGFKSKILRSYKQSLTGSPGEMAFNGVEIYREIVEEMLARKYFRIGDVPTFDQFVRFVCLDQEDHQRNIHWRHLHKCTWPKLIDYDHIIQAEDIDTKLEPIVKSFAPGFVDSEGLLVTRENSTANLDEDHDFTLSDSTLNIFGEAYAKDLDIFGYDLQAHFEKPASAPARPKSSRYAIQPTAPATKTRLLMANCPLSLDEGRHVTLERTADEHREVGPINFGDALVCEATLRVIGETGEIENIALNTPPSDERLEELRDSYDALVIRGSNYLAPTGDLGVWADTLEKLEMPVVSFGLGAQYPDRKLFRFPPGTERFLKVAAELGGPIGVRGLYTAELLDKHNIPVDPIGCPTVIRSGKPELSIQKSNRLSRWGVTINRELRGDYAASNELVERLQQQLARIASSDGRGILLGQGEIAETVVALGDHDPDFIQQIATGLGLLSIPGHEEIIAEITRSHLKTGEWTEEVRDLDLVIGFRLHGNVIALGAEVPTVFVSYDSRTAELVELLDAPYIDVIDAPTVDIDAVYAEADFAPFEKRYAEIFGRFQEYVTDRLPDRGGFFGDAEAPVTSDLLTAPRRENKITMNHSSHVKELVDVSHRLDLTSERLWRTNRKLDALQTEDEVVQTPSGTSDPKHWGLTT